ncbi:hypothetical protein OUZ56_001911 [Daphnia magna]|uniref:Uncharacterized protein n=1 Tax=Daphnia magna TaxID=35525 RepID=A0ABR0A442_9CRUS|nr:hypothetical protein OUZ56_001911 [Daphnia magna]
MFVLRLIKEKKKKGDTLSAGVTHARDITRELNGTQQRTDNLIAFRDARVINPKRPFHRLLLSHADYHGHLPLCAQHIKVFHIYV